MKASHPGTGKSQSSEGSDSLYCFEVPVSAVQVTKKGPGGPTQAILDGSDGQSWMIAIENDVLAAGRPITPAPIKPGDDTSAIDWAGLVDNMALVWRDEGARERLDLRNIGDGAILYSTYDATTAALSPDGLYLLLFRDEGIAVADLREPEIPLRSTGLFPIGQERPDEKPDRRDVSLDNPSSVMMVAATGAGNFTLAIGDYGFVVVADIHIGSTSETPLIVTRAVHILSEGLVYDPVDIIDIVPGKSLFVRHGYGSGIVRFDLRTGAAVQCPLPPGDGERRYGAFQSAVASTGSPGIWVKTDSGPYFWDGAGPLKRVAQEACMVLATDGDHYVGVSSDGRGLVRGRLEDPSKTSLGEEVNS